MDYYNKFIGLNPTSSYCEISSLSLAICCDLAYEKNIKNIKEVVFSWGFKFEGYTIVEKKPDIDTLCYVMSDEDNIVIVFRGSDSLKDWFANFQAVYNPGPLENTKVHEGFQDSLYPAVIGITNILDKALLSGNKRLWLTGHSLGGAQCSLYAGMLLENNYQVYGIYTFASPRPGNGVFEEALNRRVSGPHYRVVNYGDIVPHVPPEPFYSHPGERIILKQHTRENSDKSWLTQKVSAMSAFVANASGIMDVADNHRLSADAESYIPRLINDLERSDVAVAVKMHKRAFDYREALSSV